MAPKRTAKALADSLPAAEIKRLKAALKYRQGEEGVSDLAKAYEEGSREQKREILERYCEDKSLKWRFDLTRSTINASSSTSRLTTQWLTSSAIAQAEGLDIGKEEDKKMLEILLEDYESRDHTNAKLAAMGVKQYKQKVETELTDESESKLVQFQGQVTGQDKGEKKAPKKSGDPQSDATAGSAPISVSWKVAVTKVKKECATLVRRANQVLSNTHRLKHEVTDGNKTTLREGMRLCQAAVDALEDHMPKVEENETSHGTLKTMQKQMTETLDTFIELLQTALPKAVPKGKGKGRGEEKAENGNESK